MPLQPNDHIQFLLFCDFRNRQYFLYPRRISGYRLLHEHMLVLFDSFLEMERTETGRRGQYHHVG